MNEYSGLCVGSGTKSSLRAAAESQNAFDDFASVLKVVFTYVRSLERRLSPMHIPVVSHLRHGNESENVKIVAYFENQSFGKSMKTEIHPN